LRPLRLQPLEGHLAAPGLTFACGIRALFACLVLFAAPVSSEPVIADNSFLIEEAYNQEKGVVQHILSIVRKTGDEDDIIPTFTQEWPFFSQKHQLSYTFTYFVLLGDQDTEEVGDLLLHYRYQLGAGEHSWAVAPRASLIVPLGGSSSDADADEVGFQTNLPVSVQWSPSIVTHFNAGMQYLEERTTPFFGGSIIGPVDHPVNLMLEALWTFPEEVGPGGESNRPTEAVFSPGIRGGFTSQNVQVVPGFAVPTTWRNGESSTALFVYISIEHSFTGQ
jgi:hypothetical protein